MSRAYFSPRTFAFLEGLSQHNERGWFDAHRQDYEDFVRTPALDFIDDMAREMPSISRHFLAIPNKVGGSLMRIHRDTRFSRDKRPYKTNVGIQFRHESGRDVHAPGYYLHLEPGQCFLGIGLWHPDPDTLFKIREAVTQHGDAWVAARDDHDFRTHFTLEGESLARVPRGFAGDHPLAEDLKRKDFIAMVPLREATATSTRLLSHVADHYRRAGPYMRFLCRALDLPF